MLGDSQNVNLSNIYIAVSQMNDPNYWGENDFLKSEIDPKLPTGGSPPSLTADCFSRRKRMISSTSLTCHRHGATSGTVAMLFQVIKKTRVKNAFYFWITFFFVNFEAKCLVYGAMLQPLPCH